MKTRVSATRGLIFKSIFSVILVGAAINPSASWAAEPQVGRAAPLFSCKTHTGSDFSLSSQKGTGHWTVLYFYPKAETPGCTKQACAFRDGLKNLQAQKVDVFGISGDDVKSIAAFHKNHQLNFDLLADPDAKIIEAYGVKMPLLKMSKRVTFVLDDHLTLRWIEKDVDPVKDAGRVMEEIKSLKNAKSDSGVGLGSVKPAAGA